MLGGDELALAMANKLREAGFYVRAIRPPTVPEGTSRLRICLSAAHTADQISGLVLALKRLLPAKVIKV
jgi:8-amino-7-oxononanoate synthase